jgi:hypothetical protein
MSPDAAQSPITTEQAIGYAYAITGGRGTSLDIKVNKIEFWIVYESDDSHFYQSATGADESRVTENCSGNNEELDTKDIINPLNDEPRLYTPSLC